MRFYILVVQEAQQLDLAQGAFGVRIVVESVPNLLHGDLAARGGVAAGAVARHASRGAEGHTGGRINGPAGLQGG